MKETLINTDIFIIEEMPSITGLLFTGFLITNKIFPCSFWHPVLKYNI